MFRYRRYRVFLAFAVITLVALYKFGTSGATWRDAASTATELKNEAEDALGFGSKPRPAIAHETKILELQIPAASRTSALQTPPPVKHNPTPAPSKAAKPSIPTPIRPNPRPNAAPPADGSALSSSIEAIYWTKLPEKFPVPSQSLIKLPRGKPQTIPKIQHKFEAEDAAAKKDRLAKLEKIRAVFKKSWDGYREYAWLHDELKPESGTFKDPFAGWGATLVDGLDTLWIMGLKKEFDEAVKAVDSINFRTTHRADIPLFETTIRYLGGLLAAYDISGKKYKNLLDKAVELAEVLMSTFDTPNRMPETYYYWRPQFASQKHRASTHVVLAEIGSLSMEFTRLAQLTGEHKYYDAIARITDNLEEFQNKTRLTGMWPTYIDVSGCGKVPVVPAPQAPLKASKAAFATSDAPSPTPKLSPEGKKYVSLQLPDPIVLKNNDPKPTGSSDKGVAQKPERQSLKRRQLDEDVEKLANAAATSAAAEPTPTPLECVDQGFAAAYERGREEYTLGGMSDSTYEYLPKEYLLLGGQIEKYRAMYEQSMDVVKEHLIFRPMLPNEDDILFSGKLNVPPRVADLKPEDLVGENAHLTCFAGGMLGMGAKLFDRPEDLEIAKKLTEGCVWSYNMTQTGIMPESFETIPCKSATHCPWNQTLYWETLDPRAEYRLNSYKEQMETFHSQFSSASSWYEEALAAMTAPPKPTADPVSPDFAEQTYAQAHGMLEKRQLNDNRPSPVQPSLNVPEIPLAPSPTVPDFPYLYTPVAPLNHKDFVQHKIKEERLPPGVTLIGARNYILR
jgi:mannosyl-oligosaccharide alpha-1,2-mannosidase